MAEKLVSEFTHVRGEKMGDIKIYVTEIWYRDRMWMELVQVPFH